ncbi:MAG TPA: hypothetical protein VN703_00460 [Candidatus Sulfopaludibacter sp.]|nr:hypothetical protein [Candidatus Sulfopaludibacter sp.]
MKPIDKTILSTQNIRLGRFQRGNRIRCIRDYPPFKVGEEYVLEQGKRNLFITRGNHIYFMNYHLEAIFVRIT